MWCVCVCDCMCDTIDRSFGDCIKLLVLSIMDKIKIMWQEMLNCFTLETYK